MAPLTSCLGFTGKISPKRIHCIIIVYSFAFIDKYLQGLDSSLLKGHPSKYSKVELLTTCNMKNKRLQRSLFYAARRKTYCPLNSLIALYCREKTYNPRGKIILHSCNIHVTFCEYHTKYRERNMHIYPRAVGDDSNPEIDNDLICPYLTAKNDFCSASIMVASINTGRKANYCSTEDYDRCPLFLAKVLRGG